MPLANAPSLAVVGWALSKSALIFQAMLRNFNVGEPVRCGGSLRCKPFGHAKGVRVSVSLWDLRVASGGGDSNWRCVVAKRRTVKNSRCVSLRHNTPYKLQTTNNLYFFIYIEFFSPTYLSHQ
jgi:hypothetical protein